jgi:hypothetical protein
VLDQRGRLLRAALGFAGLPHPPDDRALWALRTWLDSWSGIRRVAVGMAHQGFDLQLTRYDNRGWRATFYTTGMEHSPTSATGSAWKRTPCHALQGAARDYHIARGKDLRAGVARVADYVEALNGSVQESGTEPATTIKAQKAASRK